MHKTPRAHEITDRLSFSLHFTHHFRTRRFFAVQSLSSGTIRNALAAVATSAHTAISGATLVVGWTPATPSTSSPQHCSGDTEEEDARAAARRSRPEEISQQLRWRLMHTHTHTVTHTPRTPGLVAAAFTTTPGIDACVRLAYLETADGAEHLFCSQSNCCPPQDTVEREVLANFGHCVRALEFGHTDYDRLRKSSQSSWFCPHTQKI